MRVKEKLLLRLGRLAWLHSIPGREFGSRGSSSVLHIWSFWHAYRERTVFKSGHHSSAAFQRGLEKKCDLSTYWHKTFTQTLLCCTLPLLRNPEIFLVQKWVPNICAKLSLCWQMLSASRAEEGWAIPLPTTGWRSTVPKQFSNMSSLKSL